MKTHSWKKKKQDGRQAGGEGKFKTAGLVTPDPLMRDPALLPSPLFSSCIQFRWLKWGKTENIVRLRWSINGERHKWQISGWTAVPTALWQVFRVEKTQTKRWGSPCHRPVIHPPTTHDGRASDPGTANRCWLPERWHIFMTCLLAKR